MLFVGKRLLIIQIKGRERDEKRVKQGSIKKEIG
jgi:hypothetical protein